MRNRKGRELVTWNFNSNALVKLQALYHLEREAHEANMPFEERHAHRQEHALLLSQEIKTSLK